MVKVHWFTYNSWCMNTAKFLYLKHHEIASGSFCLLVNSPWMLGFCLLLFSLSITFFNIYCWKGIHFSCVYLYGVMLLLSVIISLHFWFKDLIREFYKKYEVLLMILFLMATQADERVHVHFLFCWLNHSWRLSNNRD